MNRRMRNRTYGGVGGRPGSSGSPGRARRRSTGGALSMLAPEFGNLRLYLWPTPGPKFRTVDSRRGHCSQRVDAIVNRNRNQPLIERDPGNALDGRKNCSLLTARIDHRAHELARNDDGQFSLSDAGRVAFRRKSLEVPQATLGEFADRLDVVVCGPECKRLASNEKRPMAALLEDLVDLFVRECNLVLPFSHTDLPRATSPWRRAPDPDE